MASGSHPERVLTRVFRRLVLGRSRASAPRAQAGPVEIDEGVRERVMREARAHGPIAPGWFRVIVAEPDGRYTWGDFERLKEAQAYANDAYSESYPNPLAWILNGDFVIVDTGHSVFGRT